MAESIYISKGVSTRNYSFNQDDLTDEITNTIEWLHTNQELLKTATITAYLSLLYNLVSLVTDINEKRYLYGTLIDFKNRHEYQVKLF
jgi:hypothetical protein